MATPIPRQSYRSNYSDPGFGLSLFPREILNSGKALGGYAWLAFVLLMTIHAGYGQRASFSFDLSGNIILETNRGTGPIEIIGQPQSRTVMLGESAGFSVVVADSEGVSFQWRFDAIDIFSATNDSLLLLNVSATNEGQYSVVLVNGSGSVTSSPAMLWLDTDRDGLPDPWELAEFGNVNQNPTGDFDGDGVSNRDEYLDGTNPADSASVLFRLTMISDGGNVTVNPSRFTFTNGEVVTLTAIAFAPNTFHGWTGDTNTMAPTINLAMTSDKTVFAHLGPYDITWTNAVSGDWNIASNWSPNFVPSTNDAVFINNAVTVALNSGAEVASLSLGTSGSPTLSGSGTLTVNNAATWTGGTMSGVGRTVIAPGATLIIGNTVSLLGGRTLDNGGTVLWTGGNIAAGATAVMTNRPGALFEVRNAAGLNYSGLTGARFDNAGIFRKSVSAGTTTVFTGMAFNNFNLVQIQAGTLNLGGGTHTGSFDVPVGTTLNLRGTQMSSSGSSISGAGTLTVGGGTATLGGLVNVSGTNLFDSGSVNLTGNYICTNNTMVLSGGTANISGTGTVAPAVVNQDSGTMGGNQVVTVLNHMNWTGGTMSGIGRTVIPSGATLNIGNTVSLVSGRTLDNDGTVLWTGGNIAAGSTVVMTNRPGALFEVRNAAGLNYSGLTGARFDNAGIFRKSVSAGTTTVFNGMTFNNFNIVQIQAGTLNLGGGTHSGSFDVPAGTALNLRGAQLSSSGSSISGAGTLTVGGGTATLGGLVNVSGTNLFDSGTANLTGNYICTNNTLVLSGGTANFNGTGVVSPALVLQDSGTMGGNQVVTVLNQMNWIGGTMTGVGRTIIPAGATLTIGNTISLAGGRTLDNGGTVLWTGGSIATGTTVVMTNRPGALFEVRNSTGLNYSGLVGSRFDNAGTFRKSVSTGTTTVFGGMAFNNFNLVEIQAGILAMNGGYASRTNALLRYAIGGTNAGVGYGRLQVAGTVALNGALGVGFINGFQPATNDSFTLVTAGTRTGVFSSFTYPPDQVAMQLTNTPTSVIVRVTDVLSGAEPVLITPELSGSDVRLTWTAVSNINYRVEFKPDLALTNWISLAGDVLSLSNRATKLDAMTSSNRFYRVRALP